MPVFPSQGGSKNTWGTELRNFFAPLFDLATGARVAGQIVSADIADGTIVNADIAAGAAITQSKLVDIVDADIAAGAAIVDTKLATIATANKVSDTALNIPNVKFMSTYADFATAVSAIGATVTTLIISEVETVAANVTVPSTLTLKFEGQGELSVNATFTVTINGSLDALLQQIFSGAGTIVLGKGVATRVFPQWWDSNVADGTTEASLTIQKTFDSIALSGIPVHFPAGNYKWSNTVFLSSTVDPFLYVITGDGDSSILAPSGTIDYLFRLNESAVGVKVLSFPGDRAVLSNLKVDGVGTTGAGAGLMWYNEAAPQFKNIRFNGMKNGLRGTGYTDNISMEKIYWQNPKNDPDAWLYKQGLHGDGFYANQIFSDGFGFTPNAIYLTNAAGVLLESCIQGYYVFERVLSATIQNCHFENSDTNVFIEVISSSITIRNNFFHNTGVNPPILLKEDAGYKPKMVVNIEDNEFITFVKTSAANRLFDIKITAFSHASHLRLSNNFNHIFSNGRWIFDIFGIKIDASAVALLETLLQKKKFYLSGDVHLAWDGDASGGAKWVLRGNVKAPPLVLTQNFQSVSESTAYPSSIASSTTFFYRYAQFTEKGLVVPGTEASTTTTSANNSIVLVINQTSNTMIRIWRGAATGVYDRYVDIPSGVDATSQELYDTGTHLSGMIWLTAGVPVLPTLNTTFKFDRSDTSPSVAGGDFWGTQNTSATTITTFDDGEISQLIIVKFGDTLTTIAETGNIKLSSAFTSTPDDTMSLVFDGSSWFEISRSVN